MFVIFILGIFAIVIFNLMLLGKQVMSFEKIHKSVEYTKNEKDVNFKDVIFFKKWIKNNLPQADSNIHKQMIRLVFNAKVFLCIHIFLGVVTFNMLIWLALGNVENILTNDQRLLSIMILGGFDCIFYLIPLLEILRLKKLADKFSEAMIFLLHDFKSFLLSHFLNGIIFIIAWRVLNFIFFDVTALILKIEKNNALYMVSSLLAISCYHYFVANVINQIIYRFAIFKAKSGRSFLKNSSYLYMTLMYIFYKGFYFSGINVQQYFEISIESIVIFFMLDVYIVNAKQRAVLPSKGRRKLRLKMRG